MNVMQKGKIMSVMCLIVVVLLIVMSFSGCVPEEVDTDEAEPIEGEPIVLGVLGAFDYSAGESALNSVMLAAEKINDAGGVKVGDVYRPLVVVSQDTRDLEPGIPIHDALAAVELMLEEVKPDALLVGPTRSEVLYASMDMIAEHKIPHLLTVPFDMEFQKMVVEDYEKYKYFFRVGPNGLHIVNVSAAAGIVVAELLEEKIGLEKKAYIVYQDSMAIEAAAKVVAMFYEGAGIEVVGMDPYPIGANDFSSSIASAARNGASLISPIADFPEMGILVRQTVEMEFPGMVAGYVSPIGFGEAWEVYHGDIEGMVLPAMGMGNIPVKAHPKSVEYYEDYGKMFGEEAQNRLEIGPSAASYDAVYVLVDAIERAGTIEGEELIKALEETDIIGSIGRIRFNEEHQTIYGWDYKEEAIGVVFQWQYPGVRVPIYPPDIAEGEIVLPPIFR